MSNARTDIHRPASVITEDYEYVLAGDNAPDSGPGWVLLNGDYGLEIAHRLSASDKLDRGVSQCHHCGAHIRYFAILEHAPTGDLIAVGETCLDNRFDRSSADFHALRKQAELDRGAKRIRKAVEVFVTENPDLAWVAEEVTPEPYNGNAFLSDVARKFRTYGEISALQFNAVVRVAKQVEERATTPVVEEVKVAIIDFQNPTGKLVITGEIVSLKWQEGYYGASTLKMLVKDDRGFKVWGTCPTSLPNSVRGDRVTFTATVVSSDDDESFGFFKRPTKATLIKAAVGADDE